MFRKILVGIALLSLLAAPASAAGKRAIAKGKNGQTLTASQSRNLNPKGQWITVTGDRYDETVGIYVTYCVVVPANQVPTPCGAGIDVTGKTHTSIWVSSNPPFLARPLVQPFGVGGKFKVRLRVNAFAGDYDCREVMCAITTRADHLNTDNRTADVFIPMTFATNKK